MGSSKHPFKQDMYKCQLVGYTYANCCGDVEDMKYTDGFILFYGGTTISWSSKKEPVVALSSCESEYTTIAFSTCQAIWLKLSHSLLYRHIDCLMAYLSNSANMIISFRCKQYQKYFWDGFSCLGYYGQLGIFSKCVQSTFSSRGGLSSPLPGWDTSACHVYRAAN